MTTRKWLAALLAAVLTVSSGAVQAETATLSGTVSYLNRMAVPPGAVLDVELVDVSRADAPSVRLSSRRYSIDRVPFPFDLAYDTTLIDDRFSYAVQARILVDGQVIYRNTSAFPALTRNAPETVEVVVDRMPAPVAPPAPGALENSRWEAFELRGRMLVTEKRPEIGFLPDGRMAATAGCNRFSGSVEIAGADMAFSDRMAGTLMACPPPYDQLERDFLEVLAEVTGYVQAGEQLALTNAAGVTILRLNRAE